MIVKTKNEEIHAKTIHAETIHHDGKTYPAIRIVLDDGITKECLDALTSGRIEILDDNRLPLGVHDGYTTPGEHSYIIGKITTAEQERDELAAALAIEEAKQPYIDKLIIDMDDATASTVVPLFPGMRYDGILIKAGTRINWNGKLKRAAVDLWDRPDCNPDNATDAWEDIRYRDGYRIIPEKITVGLAFNEGERGWWDDVLFESIVNNNVYTPAEYAGNWKVVTN